METVLASLAVTMNDRAVTEVAMHRSLKTRWAKSDFRRTGEPFVSDGFVVPTSGPLMVPFSAAATFASSDAFRSLTIVSVSL
jgi:hypothetical protein